MMRGDLCGLVRDAHHDLTRILVTMNGVMTPREQLLAQLESFQLRVQIHAGAEARVYEVVLAATAVDDVLASLAATMEDEHLDQLAAADGLGSTVLGSLAWHEQVRELQSRVLHHAASSERRLTRLQQRMPAFVPLMVREYVTASTTVLGVTSPLCTLRPRRTRTPRRTWPLSMPLRA